MIIINTWWYPIIGMKPEKISYARHPGVLIYHLRAHFCAKGAAILFDVDFLQSFVDSLLGSEKECLSLNAISKLDCTLGGATILVRLN
jgi:hypothetical protein